MLLCLTGRRATFSCPVLSTVKVETCETASQKCITFTCRFSSCAVSSAPDLFMIHSGFWSEAAEVFLISVDQRRRSPVGYAVPIGGQRRVVQIGEVPTLRRL